jgi:hypothetical protein
MSPLCKSGDEPNRRRRHDHKETMAAQREPKRRGIELVHPVEQAMIPHYVEPSAEVDGVNQLPLVMAGPAQPYAFLDDFQASLLRQ